MKKKTFLIVLIMILFVIGVQRKYTYAFTNNSNVQIQPLFEIAEVNSNCDTNVVFTDVETGKTYMIGYITPGMSDTIKLEKDKWYSVEANGRIHIRFVKVRSMYEQGKDI